MIGIWPVKDPLSPGKIYHSTFFKVIMMFSVAARGEKQEKTNKSKYFLIHEIKRLKISHFWEGKGVSTKSKFLLIFGFNFRQLLFISL